MGGSFGWGALVGFIVLALPAGLLDIAAAAFAYRAEDVRQMPIDALEAASFDGVEILVIRSDPAVLTAALVAACDRAGVRIAPYATDPAQTRLASSFGLAPLTSLEADQILNHAVPRGRAEVRGGVIAVWGPHGAPGRSTVAASLAVELAQGATRSALIDADVHAPSLAIMLGLTDDGPGFASACRSAERQALDAAELARISQHLNLGSGVCEVLSGINRPNRWPELSARRVSACLEVARGWAEHVVVDVAASLDQDEEIMSDVEGPRRNASTIASLQAADHVIAVASADAVGIARFVRAYGELRAIVNETPIHVVINRLRAGALGIDAKGQIRRTLSRFVGIEDVAFLPDEQVIADSSLLHARAIADIAPKSGFAAGIRKLAATLV